MVLWWGAVFNERGTHAKVAGRGAGRLAYGLEGDFGFRVCYSGFKVWGSGLRVQVSAFRVSGFGFRVSGFGFRVKELRFRVQQSGTTVQGSEFRVQGFRLRLLRRDPKNKRNRPLSPTRTPKPKRFADEEHETVGFHGREQQHCDVSLARETKRWGFETDFVGSEWA